MENDAEYRVGVTNDAEYRVDVVRIDFDE